MLLQNLQPGLQLLPCPHRDLRHIQSKVSKFIRDHNFGNTWWHDGTYFFCNIDDHVDPKKMQNQTEKWPLGRHFLKNQTFTGRQKTIRDHIGQHRVPARKDGLTEELGSSQDPLAERRGVMTFGSAYPYYYGACRSGGWHQIRTLDDHSLGKPFWKLRWFI